jgi:hypothetical protein
LSVAWFRIDLGVNADLPTLWVVADSLRRVGYAVDLREPDITDPLGGVIDVSGSFGLIQIVSFAGRFPAVVDDAGRPCHEVFWGQGWPQVASRGSRVNLSYCDHAVARNLESKSAARLFHAKAEGRVSPRAALLSTLDPNTSSFTHSRQNTCLLVATVSNVKLRSLFLRTPA